MLDDRNARTALVMYDERWKGVNGVGFDVKLIGVYLGYLIELGFPEKPRGKVNGCYGGEDW